MPRHRVRGTITSVEFDDEHRFVIGRWHDTPIGPFGDVMCRQGDGPRVLLAPHGRAADFICEIYDFDRVDIGVLDVFSDGKSTTVSGDDLQIVLRGGRPRPVPLGRPLAVTRFVEAPIAQLLMGVRAFGVSPKGATEWYQTRGWRWVTEGAALVRGQSLGAPRRFTGALGVGFSEPPRRPSIVAVTVTIDV